MISMGLYFFLCIIIFMVLMVRSVIKDDSGGLMILFFVGALVLWAHNIPEKEEFVKYEKYDIHSTAGNYNKISCTFTLGSGYINSQEMYSGNTFDGEFYERIYVPVATTKRLVVGYLNDKAIYKQPICKYNATLFRFDDSFECKNIKGILEVPKGTIVQQLNFQ